MKVNRPINDCHCDNCRKFVECYDKGKEKQIISSAKTVLSV